MREHRTIEERERFLGILRIVQGSLFSEAEEFKLTGLYIIDTESSQKKGEPWDISCRCMVL